MLLFAQTAHPLTQVVLTRYSEVRWRHSDDEFSVLESVCHLRVIAAEDCATRINHILDEINPFLTDIDGGRLALERSYNDQDASPALCAFVFARTKNLERLRGVNREGLEREGTLDLVCNFIDLSKNLYRKLRVMDIIGLVTQRSHRN